MSQPLPVMVGAREAAQRLGVKPATLYAYVSRGLLQRERAADGRSRFRLVEIERLVSGRAASRRPPRGHRPLTSAITTIADRSLLYRGRDAAELARQDSFESVATWLWSGRLDGESPWRAEPEALAVGGSAQAALPVRALPLDRLRVIVAAVSATDDLRHDTSPDAVEIAGRRLLSAMVDCLSESSPPAGGSLAARFWSRFSREHAPAAGIELVNAALVLSADHELSTSTVAARLAASIRADPYAVVGVGLSALGGALHSVASLAAEDLLADIVRPEEASTVIGERLRSGERLPGFGHRLHPGGDPRAEHLLERLRRWRGRHARMQVVEAVLATTRSRGLPAANVDFALAAAANVSAMSRGASEAMFALARSAGWLAHALEEYEAAATGLPATRAIYVSAVSGPER